MERQFDLKRAWEELVQNLIREGILRSPHVIQAMRRVSREPFLPDRVKSYVAADSPLPIGYGQTISAPLDRSLSISRAKHGFDHE